MHLRIVAHEGQAEHALELLEGSGSVCNVALFEGAARKPKGDVILADVAREDASVIIEDLRALGIPKEGSISIENVDTQISDAADRAVKHAPGLPSDAVIWEDVESRSEEMTELSLTFVLFMVASMQLAGVAILLDQPVLLVGAMVVGPEFGPLASLCVAVVERKSHLARRSLVALVVGFPVGVVLTLLATLFFDGVDLVPGRFDPEEHPLTGFVSNPDFFSAFVALVAGMAGMLSLTSAKSGALVGVLVSVTTIPAAANIGVAAALGAWGEAAGATAQLAINLAAIVLAGVITLYLQRRFYVTRRRKHRSDPARLAAGLPLGSRRSVVTGSGSTPSDDSA
ncbi:MAG: DUF389 domain-containing protein [Thermoleophilaceae bacterium]